MTFNPGARLSSEPTPAQPRGASSGLEYAGKSSRNISYVLQHLHSLPTAEGEEYRALWCDKMRQRQAQTIFLKASRRYSCLVTQTIARRCADVERLEMILTIR